VITDELNVEADTLYYVTFVNESAAICINAYDPDNDVVSISTIEVAEGNAEIMDTDSANLCFDIVPGINFLGQVSVILAVRDNGVPAMYDSVIVSLWVEPKLEFSQAISPNNDGINDFLVITGIEKFPGNTLTVFNRWGDIVYSKESYNNEIDVWEGQAFYNGSKTNASEGTYFYILEIEGYSKPIKGFVVLKR
jgi:gliding motility-associated-like protein